jgi:hypothetical protein
VAVPVSFRLRTQELATERAVIELSVDQAEDFVAR